MPTRPFGVGATGRACYTSPIRGTSKPRSTDKENAMVTRRILLLGVSFGLLLSPTLTRAQSTTTGSIAGVVRDATGAVLPGVTVEAASPALIEKVRSVVTDDAR